MNERPPEPSKPHRTPPSQAEPPPAEPSGSPEPRDMPPGGGVPHRPPQGEGIEDESGEAERSRQPLFPSQQAEDYLRRWEAIQTAFVDQPKRSVEEADRLVADVLDQVAQVFSSGREGLEATWGRGEDASTEELRLILQRYRSFFIRLLSA
jgi:hypothetical protein